MNSLDHIQLTSTKPETPKELGIRFGIEWAKNPDNRESALHLLRYHEEDDLSRILYKVWFAAKHIAEMTLDQWNALDDERVSLIYGFVDGVDDVITEKFDFENDIATINKAFAIVTGDGSGLQELVVFRRVVTAKLSGHNVRLFRDDEEQTTIQLGSRITPMLSFNEHWLKWALRQITLDQDEMVMPF